MVARTHSGDSLTVVFERDGHPLITADVADGLDARTAVLKIVSDTERLQAGDRLSVAAYGDDDPPAVNRGSHYSA